MKKYEKYYVENENVFSISVIFLIKLLLYIKKLEDIDKNCPLINFFMSTAESLCKDAHKLQKKYLTSYPLVSKNLETNELYNEFQNYILKDYIYDKKLNFEQFYEKINLNQKDTKRYMSVIYIKNGRAKMQSIRSQLKFSQMPEKKKFLIFLIRPKN